MDRREFIGTTLAAIASPLLSEADISLPPNKEVAGPQPKTSRRQRYKENLGLAEKPFFKEFLDEVVKRVTDKFRCENDPDDNIGKHCHPDLYVIKWGDREGLYRQAAILGDVFLKIIFDESFKEMILVNLPPEEMFRIDGIKEGDAITLNAENSHVLEFQRTLKFPDYKQVFANLREPLAFNLVHSVENESKERILIHTGGSIRYHPIKLFISHRIIRQASWSNTIVLMACPPCRLLLLMVGSSLLPITYIANSAWHFCVPLREVELCFRNLKERRRYETMCYMRC